MASFISRLFAKKVPELTLRAFQYGYLRNPIDEDPQYFIVWQHTQEAADKLAAKTMQTLHTEGKTELQTCHPVILPFGNPKQQ